MMTSSIKDNSWASRAGVVVGYQPEDTMKSFLFNQNNKHCINLTENDIAKLDFPQNEIEKALDLLSSDSESESSSMTKITVKNVSSTTDNSYDQNAKFIKISKADTDFENWNKSDNSDSDGTSADISNDFIDRTPIANSKMSFEEILEEKLKQENSRPKTSNHHTKSQFDGAKPKFTFLKKNAGKSAWCSNVRPDMSRSDKRTNQNSRSQSSERDVVKRTQESNNNNQPIRRMKSMTNMSKKPDPGYKAQKPPKNPQKSVHFALSCQSDSQFDLKSEDPVTMNQSVKKVAEIENCNLINLDESRDLEKELVEFELLEQIANVSISSSITSSIAMYDEENLRERLWKVQNMPPPTVSYTRNKCIESQSIKPSDTIKNAFRSETAPKKLSTCEELSENIQTTNVTDNEFDNNSDDDLDSQNTSNNTTTTLSEFQEKPRSLLPSNFPTETHNQKPQTFSRKIAKPKERYKESDNDDEEWIEESPFHLEKEFGETVKTNSQKMISKIPNVDWTFADPFHQSSSEEEEEDYIKDTKKPVSKEKSENMSIFPNVVVDKQQSIPEENVSMQSAKLKQWVQLLESEVARFKSENGEIERLKKEKEDGLKRLEKEIENFQKQKEDETRKFEEYKQMEIKKLKKERKVFDDYQEAMKNMPNKKDRQDIENLKNEIETMKDEYANKESRWQAANVRLKQKVEQLETENSSLHSRIHTMEQKRLQLQAQLVSNNGQKVKSETSSAKPKQTVTSVSQAVSMKHSNIPIGVVSKEDNNNNKCAVGSTKSVIPVKKSTNKPTNNNASKPQKPLKNTPNPFSSENGIIDIRGSAASDYYTGEEESGSVDLKPTNQNFAPASHRSDKDAKLQNKLFSLRMDRSNHVIKDEIHHADGILERIYMNGGVDVIYPNGTLKQISADSKSVIIHFYNGDIKQSTPDGRIIYFYAQDESTQTTFANGKEEILYKDGNKEVIHPNGIREITFPDHSIKLFHPDSREETYHPSGMVIRVSSTGDKEILLPNGQKEIHANGVKKRIYPDGTTKTVYPDGRQETYYASGRMRVKDKSGNLILDQYLNNAKSD